MRYFFHPQSNFSPLIQLGPPTMLAHDRCIYICIIWSPDDILLCRLRMPRVSKRNSCWEFIRDIKLLQNLWRKICLTRVRFNGCPVAFAKNYLELVNCHKIASVSRLRIIEATFYSSQGMWASLTSVILDADLYCYIISGQEKTKTTSVKASTTCYWNESFIFHR